MRLRVKIFVLKGFHSFNIIFHPCPQPTIHADGNEYGLHYQVGRVIGIG
jgi:hypothetical protein